MDMNLIELRQNISNIINQAGLPVDAVYFVMKDIMNEITDLYSQQINNMVTNATESSKVQQKEKNDEITEAVTINKNEEE